MVRETCKCGKQLDWIPGYGRFYCKKCRGYPPTCPDCKRDLFWVPEYGRYYCNTCTGYKQPKTAVPMPEPSRPSPTMQVSSEMHAVEEIDEAFSQLKRSYAEGSIDEARYRDSLNRMKFCDEYGRFWTVGARTGRWHYHDGTTWTEASPPRMLKGTIYKPSQ